ncbi:hypothetical protein GLOTRDRAFT_140231 [Gloeophyllum trabeum ATCC 11539]|uniref:RNI-like protein n=1 Tax=Gloeophyllum trabeum (strain ATCC 11539 / FP-39264 / Madison 617) TaxID=670483 RepID=S7RE90_GLOTA|nr:uncharacterized protein GLOTRDRAFT_140231 [Gloeophyllum trabeum ATCC 11539]EPQ52505.1 hypothetical protein GLOTRDRAFT_140231 [Gloeophyllum trabeum ATCC 11539]
MPPDLWKESQAESSSALVLARSCVETDWERFTYYAMKVQGIYALGVHKVTLDALIINRPSLSFLPNLDILCSSFEEVEYLLPFFVPAIREVRIRPTDPKLERDLLPKVILSLAAMVQLSPNIRDITVEGDIDISANPAFMNTLKHLRDVRLFSCSITPISLQFLTALASWPQLTSLRVHAARNSGWTREVWTPLLELSASDVPEGLQFRSLRKLFVAMNQRMPEVVMKSFGMFHNLTRLQVLHQDAKEPTKLQGWLEDIGEHCSPKCLQLLELVRWKFEAPPQQPAELFLEGAILKPLKPFSMLRTLRIDVEYALNLSDETLEEFASCWPLITRLDLCTDNNADPSNLPRVMVTPLGLISLVKLCPDLEQLSIVFDATKIRLVEGQRPGRGVSGKKTTSLDVGKSPISDALDVAEFLSDLFPSLEEVETEWGRGTREQEHWALVDSAITRFARIRREERRHQSASVPVSAEAGSSGERHRVHRRNGSLCSFPAAVSSLWSALNPTSRQNMV